VACAFDPGFLRRIRSSLSTQHDQGLLTPAQGVCGHFLREFETECIQHTGRGDDLKQALADDGDDGKSIIDDVVGSALGCHPLNDKMACPGLLNSTHMAALDCLDLTRSLICNWIGASILTEYSPPSLR